MPDPIVYVPMTQELHAILKANPWDFTGRVRISLNEGGELAVEILHDCFLMQCPHRLPSEFDGPAHQPEHCGCEAEITCMCPCRECNPPSVIDGYEGRGHRLECPDPMCDCRCHDPSDNDGEATP